MIVSLETILTSFFQNAGVRLIFVLIGLDVATGIGAAIKIGYFDWQKVATFYRTNVMPYIPGYFVLWLFTAFGLGDVIPNEIAVALNLTGAGFIAAALVGSIWDNIQRTRAPLVPTDDDPVSATGIAYGPNDALVPPFIRPSGQDPDRQADTHG